MGDFYANKPEVLDNFYNGEYTEEIKPNIEHAPKANSKKYNPENIYENFKHLLNFSHEKHQTVDNNKKVNIKINEISYKDVHLLFKYMSLYEDYINYSGNIRDVKKYNEVMNIDNYIINDNEKISKQKKLVFKAIDDQTYEDDFTNVEIYKIDSVMSNSEYINIADKIQFFEFNSEYFFNLSDEIFYNVIKYGYHKLKNHRFENLLILARFLYSYNILYYKIFTVFSSHMNKDNILDEINTAHIKKKAGIKPEDIKDEEYIKEFEDLSIKDNEKMNISDDDIEFINFFYCYYNDYNIILYDFSIPSDKSMFFLFYKKENKTFNIYSPALNYYQVSLKSFIYIGEILHNNLQNKKINKVQDELIDELIHYYRNSCYRVRIFFYIYDSLIIPIKTYDKIYSSQINSLKNCKEYMNKLEIVLKGNGFKLKEDIINAIYEDFYKKIIYFENFHRLKGVTYIGDYIKKEHRGYIFRHIKDNLRKEEKYGYKQKRSIPDIFINLLEEDDKTYYNYLTILKTNRLKNKLHNKNINNKMLIINLGIDYTMNFEKGNSFINTNIRVGSAFILNKYMGNYDFKSNNEVFLIVFNKI